MKVLFKRNWLTPSHNRIRVRGKAEVHDVPEEWKDKLPPSAKIVDEAFIIESVSEEKEPETFSEFGKYLAADHERQSVELMSMKQEEADATIAAHKAMRAKRNRQAGAARAREARLNKEKENAKVD